MKSADNTDTIKLTVSSDPRFIPLVRSLITQAALEAGFEERDAAQVTLAVGEACTNIIRHSYEGDTTQRIDISCCFEQGNFLEISLRDFGKKPDPEKLHPRDLEDVRPGGLGIHFIREIMDMVEYHMEHDVGTEMKLLKHVPRKSAAKTTGGKA